MKEIQRKTSVEQLLAQIPLFREASPNSVHYVIRSEKSVYASFDAGETLYDADCFPHAVGLIVSGAAVCYGLNGDRAQPVLLNRFGVGDVFGMAAAFAPDDTPLSRVSAEKRCRAFFMPHDLLRELIHRDPAVAEQYIRFLSGRVAFLNRKIVGFTAGEAENRVAVYLMQQSRQNGSTFMLPCSVRTLCAMLNLGRASVYRAFDQLTAHGALIRDGRQFTVRDPAMLQRFCTHHSPEPDEVTKG